jgi:hypothetical protein
VRGVAARAQDLLPLAELLGELRDDAGLGGRWRARLVVAPVVGLARAPRPALNCCQEKPEKAPPMCVYANGRHCPHSTTCVTD